MTESADGDLTVVLVHGGFLAAPVIRSSARARATSASRSRVRSSGVNITPPYLGGLQVRHCEEMRFPCLDPAAAPPPHRTRPDHPSGIWTLRPWCPAAFRAASSGSPLMIFWKFQRAES